MRPRIPARGATLVLTLIAAMIPAPAVGDERLAGIACRSVHLRFPAPEGDVFSNEVTIDRSAEGTYFCVCGFGHGYFGLQELPGGKKVAIFSVWDPGRQDDPKAVPEGRRVRLEAKGEGVRVGRFGNEGTGGQSFLDLDWTPGATYRLLVTARVEGERTSYAAWLMPPGASGWRHMATFSTLAGGDRLSGCYAFVEDFRRDRVSATRERRARFGNGWVRAADGRWVALTRARFTADANPSVAIDAGVEGDRFFLATGGATANAHVPLGREMDRPPQGLDVLP